MTSHHRQHLALEELAAGTLVGHVVYSGAVSYGNVGKSMALEVDRGQR